MIENIKQRKIIRELTRNNGQKYSELLKLFPDTDKIAYHLNYLLNKSCVIKENGGYYITLKGANEIANFKWDTLENVDKHTLNYFGLVCKYKNRYLIKPITTDAFRNWYKLPGELSEVDLSHSQGINKCISDYMKVNISLSQLRYLSTHHRIVITPEGDFSWDSYLIIFETSFSDAQYQKYLKYKPDSKWLTKNRILKLKNKWPELDLCFSDKIQKPFQEYYISKNPKYNKILI